MRRHEVRRLKRAVTNEDDHDAMHALLRRSVRMGHRRLALQRCMQAERMGICVDEDLLAYCQAVASAMTRDEIAAILMPAPGR